MDAAEPSTRWAAGPADVRAAFAVRERVFCVEQGVPRARLTAQLDAVRVYEGVGFAVCSERFDEAGIPHVRMAQTLGRGRA